MHIVAWKHNIGMFICMYIHVQVENRPPFLHMYYRYLVDTAGDYRPCVYSTCPFALHIMYPVSARVNLLWLYQSATNGSTTSFIFLLIGLKFEEETSEVLRLEHSSLCMVLKLGQSEQQIRNTWKVLKFGAGEEWRSVGPIM